MSVQNESRELIQNIGSKLIYDYDQILYSWATGVGKSRVALKAVKEATSISKKKWLLFCKEVAHIENWKQEVEKHGLTDWFNETFEDVLCYASAHKYRDTEYNLCLDECHALSEMREDHLSTIRADKIISLSATVPFEVKQRLNNLKPFYEFHISLQEAIDKGLLSEPEVFIVYEDLDDNNKIFSYKIKDKEYRVTAKGFYQYLDNQVDYWSSRAQIEQIQWVHDKWMRTALERKRFIASQKTKKATSLLKELQDKRLICFTGSVAQAKELGGKYAVHSKNKNNQELIDNFNDYQSDKLFAVGMLREGMNLSSLDCAVIVQLDNQEKSLVQMTGRSLRSLAPKVFIIVLRDTMDMKYLEKAKSVFNPEYIKKYEQTAI